MTVSRSDSELAARLLRRILLGLILGSCAGSAHAETWADRPPPIGILRQGEDYGYLRDPEARQGFWWEPLKALRLESSPSAPYLALGGEARVRYEWIGNSDFGAGPQDSGGYLLSRYLPYVSLTLRDASEGFGLRLFGQAEIAKSDYDARGPGPIDVEKFDLIEAFLEVSHPLFGGMLRVQVGRQVTIFGTERLIGSRYGPNLPLSFDGGILRWQNERWDLRAFYLRPVAIDPEPLNNESSSDRQLWGFYGTKKWPGTSSDHSARGIDFYYLGLSNRDARYQSGSGRETRHTVGSRFFGTNPMGSGVLDWNYEGIFQFGSFDQESANRDIVAWSVGTETGYTLPYRFSPRLALRANIISGDGDASDHQLGTFNPLFPKGKYFGELTPIGPSNLINLGGALSLSLTETISLSVQGGPYWRYSTDDAIYSLGGGIVRPATAGGGGSRFIGTQFEVVGEWKPTRELGFLASYSFFVPGDFIEEASPATSPAKTIHFFALEASFQF